MERSRIQRSGTSQRLAPLAGAPSILRELQAETILLALPGFYVAGIVLLVSARRLDDPLQRPEGFSITLRVFRVFVSRNHLARA